MGGAPRACPARRRAPPAPPPLLPSTPPRTAPGAGSRRPWASRCLTASATNWCVGRARAWWASARARARSRPTRFPPLSPAQAVTVQVSLNLQVRGERGTEERGRPRARATPPANHPRLLSLLPPDLGGLLRPRLRLPLLRQLVGQVIYVPHGKKRRRRRNEEKSARALLRACAARRRAERRRATRRRHQINKPRPRPGGGALRDEEERARGAAGHTAKK